MTAMTSKLRLLPSMALFLAAALFGCTPPNITSGIPARDTNINTSTAAARLGLAVIHTSRTSATLRGGCNSVVMYSDPAGEVYVNGRSMPDSDGIQAENGTLLVPEQLVRRIEAVLRPGPGPGNTTLVREPVVRIPPVRPTPPKRIGRVVLDPGHGGKDPGATSSLGYYEKDLVLAVSKMVAAELTARGVEVIMTRTDDRFLELEDRPAVAARTRSDLFVSIHADAAANRSATGFTAYVDRSPSRESLGAANAILRRMCASCTPSRGVKNADYRVLVHSRTPAVLVELGFLSNRAEARKLNTAAYQRTVAQAVALGIYDALR